MNTFQDPEFLRLLYGNAELISSRGDFLKKHSNRKYSIRDFLISILPSLSNKRILDVGSGNCSFLKLIHDYSPNTELHALDIVENSACQSNFINHHLYDGVEVPKFQFAFDLILCMHMLYHIENIPAFLLRIKNLLNTTLTSEVVITTKSKHTFPKIEAQFLHILERMNLRTRYDAPIERAESKFCLENADSILEGCFSENNFKIRKYVLETQIITKNVDDVLKYVLSTQRYNLFRILGTDENASYIKLWKDWIEKEPFFIDKYIEGVYQIRQNSSQT